LEDFETYEMKTEEFFNDGWLKGTADLIFIDADQSYAGVKSDLMNSLKVLSEDGMIIMNNTDPISEKNMTAEGHKLVDEIEEGKIPHMNVTTLPIGDGGLSIITNKKCSRTQQRASSPDKVDKDGKLKPKFYVPEAYNLSEYAEMKANSPYKQY
jgi:spermidine synthase